MNRRWSWYLVVVVILLHPTLAGAQPTIWVDADASAVAGLTNRLVVPDQYRTVRLDEAALDAVLAKAPLELTVSARPVVALPMPDGTLSRFAVVESPIVDPALAARYPEIKTYRGQGIDDRSATTRFGVTAYGFHAIILSAAGTAYVDPYSRDRSEYYVSYWKRDYLDSFAELWSCTVHEQTGEGGLLGAGQVAASSVTEPRVDSTGTTLRTYRLALAANYEYTQFHSGGLPNLPSKSAAVQRGMIPTMNRVNALYERDLSIRMILIDNEQIIWDQPADPYVNEDGISMLATNQAVLEALVGSASFDIGHVFSTGGGGVAGLGVVCRNLPGVHSKGAGVTGNPSPTGDPFDVDYVAHEMGHQFNARHTFNGTTGSCSGTNRTAATAYEVGSGSTIMAYAGICGAQNLQPNSDDLFHNISFVEISNFSRTGAGNGCAATILIPNNPPVVTAGADVTIPSRTPFTLTVASAGDPDADALTYAWEEFDLGAANDGTTDNGSSPILRAFNAVSSPSRTFPKLSDILNGTTTYGELLPTTNRTMRFRVTVRDNASGGGQIAWAERRVTSVASAGPFRVTAPAGGEVWAPGESRSVTWDVAATTAPPINAASVRIMLSTDGGQSFPHVLAESANSGAAMITVPAVHAVQARIRVEAVGNVFFHISKGFSIIPPGLPVAVDDSAATPHNTSALIDVRANDTDPDGDALQVVSVQSPTQRGGTAVIEAGAVRYTPASGFAGTDRFTYTVSDGTWQATATVTVTVAPLCPPTPAPDFVDTFEPAAKAGWQVQTAANRNAVKRNWEVALDPLGQSPVRSWFGDAGILSFDLKDDRLVAPAQNLTAGSRLVFWHRFEFEGGATGFDGGVLEVSLDGGTTWSDVGESSFVSGGYNATMSPSFGSPIGGRRAWSGRQPTMQRVEVTLGAFSGFGVLVRWRLTTDPLAATRPGIGWWIDDVQFTNLVQVPATCALPPVAVDDVATAPARGEVVVGVLGNDSDPNGDALHVGQVTQGANGSVTNNGHSVTYRPAGEFVGDDNFTYTACDGGGLCDTASVTVTVFPVNRPPQAGDDFATTMKNTAVSISVLANDADPDGDPVTITSVSQPAHGSAVDDGDGTITYTPAADFTGTDSFTYEICDPQSLCDTATVSVTVEDTSLPTAVRVAGGGWLPASEGKAHFAVNARGGVAPSGKFSYWVGDLRVKGAVGSATRDGLSHAVLSGTCELQDGSPCTFRARMEDNAEPGAGADRFEIEVFKATGASVHKTGGVLGGGDIDVE